MTYTLLVWEEIPENTKMFMIPNEIADKYRNYLEEAHNRYINIDETNDGMNFLNYALAKEKWAEGYPMEEHTGVFADYEVNFKNNPISNVQITFVYHSGFCL